MASPHPLFTPPPSQACSSQKLPSVDNAEWHLENERRLVAIELQKRKVEELEQRRQVARQQRSELQRRKDEGLAAAKLKKEKRLAAAELQREKRLVAIELQREKFEVLDLREKIQERDRLRKLNDAAARLELQRVKEQLQATRAEQSRLNSLAIIEQDRELWRLQEEARALKLREQKRLRDEAGMRAGGAYKRPISSQQITEPVVKRRIVGAEDRYSRYICL
jgi:hypothetical protein